MTLKHGSFGDKLRSKAKRGGQGFPIATIAYYGPDNLKATKVVVGVIANDGGEPDPLERWFSASRDVRTDAEINKSIYYMMLRHGVKSVVMVDRIFGCPHEEGIDYPEGETCPECPYWANRDRFSGAVIQ